jgi:hypothetical protein
MLLRLLVVLALIITAIGLDSSTRLGAQNPPPPPGAPPGPTPCTPPAGQVAIFNTGVDGCGNLLPDQSADPHFSLSGGSAFVVTNGPFPLDSSWLADGPRSKWIAPSPTASGAQFTTFDYQTTFDLTGFDPSTVTLTGSWATDNEGVDIFINGKSTGFSINPADRAGFRSLSPFTISTGFVVGVNTLDFIVHNDEAVTGLRVEVSGAGTPVRNACEFSSFTGETSGRQITSSNPLNQWSMDFGISINEGLVLSNVILGTRFTPPGGVARYMARKLSLPQYRLSTPSGITSCNLTENATGSVCRSRLVSLTQSDQGPAFVIEATYAIDKLPDDSSGDVCLALKQRYEFHTERTPIATFSDASCEPSGTVTCAKFFPLVSYEFSVPSGTGYPAAITTAQRLEFAASGSTVPTFPTGSNSSAVFHDCELTDPNLRCGGIPGVIPLDVSPLPKEVMALAMLSGTAGDWDNFYQTYYPRILEPRLSPTSVVTNQTFSPNRLIIQGCPECAHVHWRWSSRTGPDWGGPGGPGSPLVPAGSQQSVKVAVVEAGLWNDDADVLMPRFLQVFPSPLGFAAYLTKPVLWYGASSGAQSDTFFSHGGWYSSVAR